MSADGPPQAAAVPGLTRSDLHGPGITRERSSGGIRYYDPSGAAVTNPETLHRIGALGIPPAWKDVWISPDPLGHIQATGVDSRGRTQYRYHQAWREQRDVQKFAHMLRFAGALPALRSATVRDLGGRHLDRDRVTATAVRLIDLGLFRIGGEKYAELDHHYGATTLRKHDVTVTRGGIAFDYIAKEGKRRTITVTDHAVRSVVRALVSSDNMSDSLFSFQDGDTWRPLRSHEVSSYIAVRAGGHFTAKEFRTWNATVLMALFLANADPAPTERSRKSAVNAAVRGVADWLGDTPAVARGSYIDPRVISRYSADGQLAAIPRLPAVLPAAAEAEIAVAALLASDPIEAAAHGHGLCSDGGARMTRYLTRDRMAALAGLGGPLVLAAILVPFRSSFPNTEGALALILVVVAVAANGDRLAGILAAVSAAVWFDFFLTRPYERFSITSRGDIETTVLLLVIGVAVTELAVWGRRQHAIASRRAGYLEGISSAAQAVAAGDSPAALTEQVTGYLTQLLTLRSCRFQYGIAGIGQPARLQHDGSVTFGQLAWDVDTEGLPQDTDTELLVESGGRFQGRFLMTSDRGARPTLEQRLLAVAFADQVGAALAASRSVDQR